MFAGHGEDSVHIIPHWRNVFYHYSLLQIYFLGDIQWRIQDFPEEGAPTLQGGAPTYDFAKFPQKLHEIERI